jgi:E3 ubiquitin-protein ligase UBR4
VKAVRDHTKAEKKKLAMAMRAKQLRAIGLQANEQGQVKADNSLLQQFVGLAEESGLSCSICREGYKFQPNKVLGIYTYTRPCPVEDFEQVRIFCCREGSEGFYIYKNFSTYWTLIFRRSDSRINN